MSSIFKMSIVTKIFLLFSIVILFLWVIPTTTSYYKNRNRYNQEKEKLEKLDTREVPKDIKHFHSEVFTTYAKSFFDEVSVVSIPNNKYRVTISFPIESLSKFYSFLQNISLDYKVIVEDNIIFRQKDKNISVEMRLKPY